jgi:GNAT superfamily N-acetyltransferase
VISFTIRRATPADAATIAAHRVAMFRDMGKVPTEDLGLELHAASTHMLEQLLRTDAYVGWLANTECGRVIAGAGAHIRTQLPRIAPGGRRIEIAPVPLVVNVYTEPNFRRRGVSRALMQTVQQWTTESRYDRVVLHASDAGRPLYRALGFESSNEMLWISPGGGSD